MIRLSRCRKCSIVLLATILFPIHTAAWFSRDQPPVTRIQEWQGATLVFAKQWYELQYAGTSTDTPTGKQWVAPKLVPFAFPFEEHFVELLDVDSTEKKHLVVRTHFGLKSFSNTVTGWVQNQIPDMLRTHPGPIKLAAENGNIVYLGNGRFYYQSEELRRQGKNDTWRLQPLPPNPLHAELGQMGIDPAYVALFKNKLYAGFNSKYIKQYIGTGLFVFDFVDEKWSPLRNEVGHLPVNDLFVGPHYLWVTFGEAQMIQRRGEIWRLPNNKTLFASMDSFSITRTLNFDLDPVAPEATYVDQDGGVWILSNQSGVLRYVGNDRNSYRKWEVAYKDWPGFQFVNSLRVYQGRYALIGTVDMGLIFLDLKTNTSKRLKIGIKANGTP